MEVLLFWAVVFDVLLSIFFRCLDHFKPEPLSALYYDMTRISKNELQSIIDESDNKTRNERFKEYLNSKPNYKPTGEKRGNYEG